MACSDGISGAPLESNVNQQCCNLQLLVFWLFFSGAVRFRRAVAAPPVFYRTEFPNDVVVGQSFWEGFSFLKNTLLCKDLFLPCRLIWIVAPESVKKRSGPRGGEKVNVVTFGEVKCGAKTASRRMLLLVQWKWRTLLQSLRCSGFSFAPLFARNSTQKERMCAKWPGKHRRKDRFTLSVALRVPC